MIYPFNMPKSANTINGGTATTAISLQLQLAPTRKAGVYCNAVKHPPIGGVLQLQYSILATGNSYSTSARPAKRILTNRNYENMGK